MNQFRSGAHVYVDGVDAAVVRSAWPEGSTSFMFPHYKVDIVNGDSNVAVAMYRVTKHSATGRKSS